MYTDYNSFIRYPQRNDGYLLILAPREPKSFLLQPNYFTWINHSGATWKMDYPVNTEETWPVFDIWHDGIQVPAAVNIAGVTGTANRWFQDRSVARTTYLRLVDDSDPNDADIQIAPLIAFCSNAPRGKNWVVFDVTSSTWQTIVAPSVHFQEAIFNSGIGNVTTQLSESAYYGVVLPEVSDIILANDLTRVFGVNHEFDKWESRFQWRDAEAILYHGDCGLILTFAQHRKIFTFRVVGVEPSENQFKIDTRTDFSLLSKEFPINQYDNIDGEFEANVKGKFKQLNWGKSVRLKTNQISEYEFSYGDGELNEADSVLAVSDGDVEVDVADYSVDTTTAIVTFDHTYTFGDGPIEVRIKKCVNSDGTVASTQLAAAWLRVFLIDFCGWPSYRFPQSIADDFDTAHPIEIRVHISGDSRQKGLDIVNKWCLSLFSTFSVDENGLPEFLKHDPNDLPIVGDVDIKEHDFTKLPRFFTNLKALQDTVILGYAFKPNDDVYLKITQTVAKVRKQHTITDTPNVIETYLENEADAQELAVLFLCLFARERLDTEFPVTGESIIATAGKYVTITKTRGFNSSGTYDQEMYKIKRADTTTIGSPQSSTVLHCEDLITQEIYDAIKANISTPPPVADNDFIIDQYFGSLDAEQDDVTITISNVTVTNGTLLVNVHYNMHSSNPDIEPTSVVWNGTGITKRVITNTTPESINVRTGQYFETGLTPATGTLVITFPNNVNTGYAHAFDLSGSRSLGNVGAAYNASANPIQVTIATTNGSMIFSAYTVERCPVESNIKLGTNQVRDYFSREPYGPTAPAKFVSDDGLMPVGSHKDGSGSNVTMVHEENGGPSSGQRKTMTVLEVI